MSWQEKIKQEFRELLTWWEDDATPEERDLFILEYEAHIRARAKYGGEEVLDRHEALQELKDGNPEPFLRQEAEANVEARARIRQDQELEEMMEARGFPLNRPK